MSDTAKHAIVRGRVQGVWFRASTQRQARKLGVRGWVRNLPDGTVELHAEGDAEAVAALLSWAHGGPPAARVDGVEAGDAGVEGFEGFEIR